MDKRSKLYLCKNRMIEKYRQKKNADLGSAFETFVGSIHKVKNKTKVMHFDVN